MMILICWKNQRRLNFAVLCTSIQNYEWLGLPYSSHKMPSSRCIFSRINRAIAQKELVLQTMNHKYKRLTDQYVWRWDYWKVLRISLHHVINPLIISCTCNIMRLISYMIIIIAYDIYYFKNRKISDVLI